MVHSAYDSLELISDCPTKIEAIESYGPKLLLGCSDGSLKIYAPDSSSSDRSPPSDYHAHKLHQEPYTLERNLSGFSKKPLVSMEVLESRELLLSLSESIAFHGLPNLGTIAVITKAKGANVYSWDDRRGFLCFARQKRVCIFRHDGGRGFVEVKEFGVPDVVKSMSWCGENICIGIRREYMILNSTNGALSEVFPSGRLAPPLVVSLPSGELLLGKVRSLRAPYPLIQTVVLRNARRILQSNNSVIVALENAVYGLFPVPLGAQIVQLTASGDFEEALALCKLLPPEEASLRAAKEGSIHMRYAHHLFDNGAYEDAMEHFLASQVDITYVLSLYPSIVLPKTTMVLEPEKLMDISGDSSYLSRGSSGISDDMEPSTPLHLLESEESAALESKKMSHNTLMALIKFLQKKRYGIIEKATAEGTEEVVLDAVGNNFASYESNNRFKKSNKGRGSIPVTSGAREMAAILDTALLQALLLTGQASAALELLKGLNYCDVKICEEILQKNNHHAALLELYRCNSMHHEALKLLHQLVEDSKSNQVQTELIQKLKPESIVEYLKPLCGTDPMLVLEYSMLVLESCPTQTIELFLNGNIPADLVNSYLKQHAPNMQATYLELMLAMDENGISGNLQNEMVHIYLSEVLDWHADLSAQQKWNEQTYSSTRKKLLSALESISGYNPEALLRRLPTDALYEERAILLGKMNQHELALSLYVHKLHVPELALSHCDRVYESLVHQQSSRSSGNIYLTLLQIYLNPRRTTKNFEKRITNLVSPQNIGTPKVGSANTVKSKGGRGNKKIAAIEVADDIRVGQSSADSSRSDGDADESSEEGGSTIMLDEVLDLLSRKWDRINGAQALKLLPRETKLQNLLPFMGPLLRKSSEAYRNLSVIKSLRQSENLQVKDELYEQRKGVVKITSDSMCSLCRKKIGTSVFAVYPNGKTIVHFVCFRDSQSMKTVGRGSPSPLRKL
ncbi:vam6/Vps39-like protein isoform X1 [Prunus yedoensis var. nudiflora]|uniref:Vam6/Vps39-like protein isoform X1 n=1 Tax=Prunus yedoensis var. nudiflora TaxID=2094558 RepID=A0A314YTV2_PRUYE|nr:vam6/Vps39-like protein isoform X1 [Prunus yedoensis var. nudiflora]